MGSIGCSIVHTTQFRLMLLSLGAFVRVASPLRNVDRITSHATAVLASRLIPALVLVTAR